MTAQLSRRTALALGSVAAGAAVVGTASPALAEEGTVPAGTTTTPVPSTNKVTTAIGRAYRTAATAAGGTWNSFITVAGSDGVVRTAVDTAADVVVEAYSVNKIAVATAVLDKVDRGLLSLDQQIEVSSAIVIPGGDGIFSLDGAYPSLVTVGHALAALLTVSDDTAVRLCGLVAPALEINQILVDKGFPLTQVQPVANPNRFYLGTSTARSTHGILQALAAGTLLSPSSTEYLLTVLRSPIAFTDGIRRTMSGDERARIATKAGWFDDGGRGEAGIVFDASGAPSLTYAMFSFGQADPANFGATHPAVQARATMGRQFLDILGAAAGTPLAIKRKAPVRRLTNGN
ncbi:serine hydrolase [Hamadaea tsunoensis]|uniref:serine hydrolase n=1 Tax=Hamadaea tsunoensis TaxID=53368 RepID=UPI0004886064|nr:serine hydrolase [Hamadaea tsunoensis]